MTSSFRFETMTATESVEARRVVVEFARKIQAEQIKTWEANRAAGRRNTPAPPTWEQCLQKSIETRKRRVAQDTYATELVKRHDTY